jgi:hypothetical protein
LKISVLNKQVFGLVNASIKSVNNLFKIRYFCVTEVTTSEPVVSPTIAPVESRIKIQIHGFFTIAKILIHLGSRIASSLLASIVIARFLLIDSGFNCSNKTTCHLELHQL